MAAANLWYIPYNRGFVTIDGTESTFESTYSELVMVWFDFQYIRPMFGTVDNADEYDFDDATARMMLKLSVDDVLYPGTGPAALAQDGKIRGTGFAGTDLRSWCSLITVVPPGRHTVCAKAALGPDVQMDGEWANPAFAWRQDSLYPGPAFGKRKIIVVRHPQGLPLGA